MRAPSNSDQDCGHEDDIMWRMQDGHRCLTPEEWALFAIGLQPLLDDIDDAIDAGRHADLDTGVPVFDRLQSEQQLVLLADIAQALHDEGVKAPHHTAANEGAIAAVIASLEEALDIELVTAREDPNGNTEVRQALRRLLATSEEPSNLPALTDTESDEWPWSIELLEETILWDADYAMDDEFLDMPPDDAREIKRLL